MDLVTLTEEILNGKLYFLCDVTRFASQLCHKIDLVYLVVSLSSLLSINGGIVFENMVEIIKGALKILK